MLLTETNKQTHRKKGRLVEEVAKSLKQFSFIASWELEGGVNSKTAAMLLSALRWLNNPSDGISMGAFLKTLLRSSTLPSTSSINTALEELLLVSRSLLDKDGL